MHFKLLRLYRNYRNIDSLSASMDNGELMVFGHFDRISMTDMQYADQALLELYNATGNERKSHGNKREYADIQPIILFSESEEQPIKTDKCVVVSFMQINKPNYIKTTKAFYEYANKAITNKINDIKRENTILDEVEAQIYVPLSFMNVAVIFTSDDFLNICTLLKNMVDSHLIDFQYSVLAMPLMSNKLKQNSISLSLRFIWNTGISQKQVIDSLHKLLQNKCKISENEYHITHLMGNNDCLVTILDKGYTVLQYIMNVKAYSKHMFFKYVKNIRATIRFDVDAVKISGNDVAKCTDITVNNLEKIYSKKPLCDMLTKVNKSSKLTEMAIQDLSYKIREFEKFMKITREHAKNKIAVPLYNTFISSYNAFIQTSEMWVSKCVYDDYRIMNVLDVINTTIDEMSAYYGNILHCHLGFFEERGFYNTIIGVASNIEIAYNNYANKICAAMLCDNERDVQNINVNCYIVSDKSTLVCASDPFRFNGRRNDIDNMLISINIPAPYLFEFSASSYFIIHEIAHFIGCKRREDRAQAIYNVIKRTLLNVIGEYVKCFYIGDAAPAGVERLIDDFRSDSNFKCLYNCVMKQMEIYIDNEIRSYALHRTDDNTTLYMSLLYENLDNIMREIVSNHNFVHGLAEIIADFHEKCVIYFDDLYANNYEKYDNVGTVLQNFSNMRIREFNLRIIKKTLRIFFIKMCSGAIVYNLSNNEFESNEFDKYDNSSIMLPDLESLLYTVCEASQEAYSDLMMVYISGMSFNEYREFMSKWNLNNEHIVKKRDFMSWMRVCFVAGCMGVDDGICIDGKTDFEKYRNMGIIEEMIKYFKKLIPDFKLASDNAAERFGSYFNNLKQNDENEKFRAIFGLYLDKYDEVNNEKQ